jgi:hypothetical protein
MVNEEISYDDLELLIEVASIHDIECECFEGSLLDNYVFYGAKLINIGGESANYLIVREKYVNEWSSSLVLTMTNSYKDVEEFLSEQQLKN